MKRKDLMIPEILQQIKKNMFPFLFISCNVNYSSTNKLTKLGAGTSKDKFVSDTSLPFWARAIKRKARKKR